MMVLGGGLSNLAEMGKVFAKAKLEVESPLIRHIFQGFKSVFHTVFLGLVASQPTRF
jgi:hypothetical protein